MEQRRCGAFRSGIALGRRLGLREIASGGHVIVQYVVVQQG